jgi:hypothetical protein
MTAKVITSLTDLLAALRDRRDELNISHEVIDDIAGFQSGYTSKLLAPRPSKNLGYMSLGAVMCALGVGLVLVEDTGLRRLVEGRWHQRKRPPKLKIDGALIDNASKQMLQSTSGDDNVQASLEFSTEAGTRGPDQGRGVAGPAAGEPVSVEPDRRCAGGAPRS